MPAYKSRLTVRDAKGQEAAITYWVVEADIAAAATSSINIRNAMAPVMEGAIVGFSSPGQDAVTPLAYGVHASQYFTAKDKARLLFSDTAGGFHRYDVPTPKAASFLADGETVNVAEANMAALIAAMLASHACGRNAFPLTRFIGGIRARRRTDRRFNLITLNPQLTGAGI